MAQGAERVLLLIDDEPAQGRLIGAIAARAGWRTITASGLDEALEVLKNPENQVDITLIDSWNPEQDSRLLPAIRDLFPGLPVVMITARTTVASAVSAMRAGATDFLVKPIAPDRLLAALDSATAAHSRYDELRPLSEKITQTLAFDEIVGSAPEFRAALAIAAKAARARVPILIEGESGVGKEVIAQAIHAASPRAKKALVVVNCGAIPSNLVESELFGHEKGAFTGAFERHSGRFAQADGGTLFLDEIGDLPLDAQVKLLRTLQSGEMYPVGARRPHIVDVRIIAATNRTLSEEVAAGRFREDLFYRLNVVQVTVPPLRDRQTDVPALARHLLARLSQQPGMRPLGITDDALALLMSYEWPGNVRQLQNALFRAAVLCEGKALTSADFPQVTMETFRADRKNTAVPHYSDLAAGVTLFEANGHMRPLEEIEADVIRLAIGHYRGRMSEVARRLGIGRSTLYRRLNELGIDHAA